MAPRNRHLGRRLAIGLAILLGTAVVADRITVFVAERAAASTIQAAQHLDHRPSVHIGGFPFLTQLVSGTVDNVEVKATDVVAGTASRSVHLAALTAHLHRVHISGFRSARAETVTATALIDYSALSTVLGVTISYGGTSPDGSGRVAAAQSVSVLGAAITGSASAEAAVRAGNVIAFVDPQASVDGAAMPSEVVAALTSVFAASIDVGRLPFGLAMQSIRASAAGVTVTLTGTNVTYQ